MIKDDFPILSQQINDKPLIYLDNASTTQKPSSVIEKIENYYKKTNSNIHRGVHYLSQKSTEEYESSRIKIHHFIGDSYNAAATWIPGLRAATL